MAASFTLTLDTTPPSLEAEQPQRMPGEIRVAYSAGTDTSMMVGVFEDAGGRTISMIDTGEELVAELEPSDSGYGALRVSALDDLLNASEIVRFLRAPTKIVGRTRAAIRSTRAYTKIDTLARVTRMRFGGDTSNG